MALVTVTPLRGGDGNRPIYIPRLNQEAEQGLLGAILCNNRYFHRIASIVGSDNLVSACTLVDDAITGSFGED